MISSSRPPPVKVNCKEDSSQRLVYLWHDVVGFLEIMTEEKSAEEWQKEVEELKAQIEPLTSSWKRAVADYQNLEKRVSKEKEEWRQLVNLVLLGQLLPIFDNLERAQGHLRDEGLDIVLRDFKNVFERQGLQALEVQVGEEFDVNRHECVEVVPGENDNRVVDVVAKGYIMGDKVIRPAKVKVSKL